MKKGKKLAVSILEEEHYGQRKHMYKGRVVGASSMAGVELMQDVLLVGEVRDVREPGVGQTQQTTAMAC